MSTALRDSQINEPVAPSINNKLYQQRVDFIKKLNPWTHFVTLTYSQPSGSFFIGQFEVLRRSRLFLSRLNRNFLESMVVEETATELALVQYWAGGHTDIIRTLIGFLQSPSK